MLLKLELFYKDFLNECWGRSAEDAKMTPENKTVHHDSLGRLIQQFWECSHSILMDCLNLSGLGMHFVYTLHFSIAVLPCLPSAKAFPAAGTDMRNGLRGFTGIWSKPASEVTVNTKKEKPLRAAEPVALPSCHLRRFRKAHWQHSFADVLSA